MPSCPVCGAEVEVPIDVVEGEILVCEECGAELEVIFEDESVVLAVAELKGEDWGE
ncbi:sulfonate ABC transporter [Candidatus Bathyarchaeota archaeon ex4484_205]|nr:MAG: sulfonate ABC transporter [Candidatus Bathyarchaeota archaeon ex4484_205]RLG66404.1 MAG: sulfonate ABC transporter [archaeon]HDN17597.1 sulfonate ABC transporter [Candidatus Bathyarchaeota archaeon]